MEHFAFWVLVAGISLHTVLASEILSSNHEHGKRQYLKEPLVKTSDPTQPSKKLVAFTKSEYLVPELIRVTDNVHVAIGWALGNSILIEGNDGVIIVDTTENVDSMNEILVEYRKITKKPVKAVIFTHFHDDHLVGTQAVIKEGKASHPNVTIQIYAHEMTKSILLDNFLVRDIQITRGLRQIGTALEKDENARTGSGLGPELRLTAADKRDIALPTFTFAERARYEVAGVEFELIHTPGETDDQITVWLPKEKVALPGDNIYKTFPNLYAIRGTPARDSHQWYQSLDVIRGLGAEYLVGSHTRPVVGKEAVYDVLLVYRDAIKYVNDQTLRLMNKGFFADEIVQRVQLPDSLSKHPFLQEHYGTVAWSVKGVFTNHLGWFSGDPKDLHPMKDIDRSVRMVRLLTYAQTRKECAIEIILQEAEISHMQSYSQYLATGKHNSADDKWALELADIILKLDSLEPEVARAAKQIKISALRALGIEETSANGRNYYLTYAMEMESGNSSVVQTKDSRAYSINTAPTERVLEFICLKVDGLKCQHKNYTIGLEFTDERKTYGLTLRNSVCDVFDPAPTGMKTAVTLQMTSEIFKFITSDQDGLDDEISRGNVKIVYGDIKIYKQFLDCFDTINSA